MIDLTPLDVRKKAGDFAKSLRGYDPQQVESFLELAAERFEELVKENLTLTERVERLSEQVDAQTGREKAVNDALVTAQQLREDISTSAEREADAVRAEAKVQADRIRAEAEETARRLVAEAENRLTDLRQAARELTRRRARFLANFRQLLERELDLVEVQEAATVEDYMVAGLGAEALSAAASMGANRLPAAEDANAGAPTAEAIDEATDEMAALADEVAAAAEATDEATVDVTDAAEDDTAATHADPAAEPTESETDDRAAEPNEDR